MDEIEKVGKDVWDEVQSEIQDGGKSGVREVLSEIGPMPREAFLLGLAYSDGLPVLLNLYDAIPGPVLVVGDALDFLRSIVTASSAMHTSDEVQVGIVTSNERAWGSFNSNPNIVGIFPSYHVSSEELILSLASWAHGRHRSSQSVVLVIDDFCKVFNMDFDAKQNLRWLLLRGPSNGVKPIAAIRNIDDMGAWKDAFRTFIFERGGDMFIEEDGNELRFWYPDWKK